MEKQPRTIYSSEQPVDAVEVMTALNKASSERMQHEWESYAFDRLTKAASRAFAEEEIDRELASIQKESSASGAESHKTLSVIMVDLDHFKKVNDTYGHDMGDQVLKEAVKIMTEGVRVSDTVSRWGGEEFLIVMPNASEQIAETRANEIRERIAGLSFSSGDDAFGVTASFGIASSEKAMDKDTLVKLADNALYAAKAGGRNQVVVDTSFPHNEANNESLRAANE